VVERFDLDGTTLNGAEIAIDERVQFSLDILSSSADSDLIRVENASALAQDALNPFAT
jgi:hypothetical protein